MSVTPHRRQLLRPRASQTKLNGSFNTISTPNLAGAYSNAAPQGSGSTRPGLTSAGQLPRKSSLSALTQGSLASIPDASETYGLSAVLDEDEDGGKMSYSPSRNGGEVEVGDLVDVPGNMYGTVRFLGGIHGKDGVFAGVELSREFAGRGKNNGDVEGVSYFRTSISGAGIFLPIARAIPRGSNPSGSLTPRTPSALGLRPGYNFTPPTPAIPANFSQSIGPGSRAQSPFGKKSRPSLPRPESPIRRTATLTPGPGRNQYGVTPQPQRFASPAPSKFGQSVRGTRDTSGDPPKKLAFTPRSNFKASVGPSRGQSRSNSALGQPMSFGSDDEGNTPTIGRSSKQEDSLGSTSSFNAKMRPLEHKTKEQEEEIQRLRTQLDERDKQLREQASSLAEMENSLNEVQSLMGAGSDNGRRSTDDRDTAQLRAILKEKNEKIASLTAEFDAHRADFRSTIDTLEMAASETERVYEQKVEDLLQQLHEHQERSEDVHSVAAQLKQLEELVQELEEGLEDARRGESEARGEVEFLRGEVERCRAELRREREKIAELQEKVQEKGQGVAKEIAQRDDEIRGLKAIIHSLSNDQQQQQQQQQQVQQRRRSSGASQRRPSGSMEARKATEALESEVLELKRALEAKINKEEELERELQQLRRTSNSGPTLNSQRASNMTLRSVQSNGTIKDDKPLPERPIHASGSYSQRSSMSPDLQRKGPLAGVPESDTYSATTDDSTLWCEICETGGHDILTCTNMFGAASNETPKQGHPQRSSSRMADKAMPPPPPPQRTGKDLVRETLGVHDEFTPAPLSPVKKPSIAAMQLQEVKEAEKSVPPSRNQSREDARKPAAPTPNQSFSMEEAVAGKESGVIDMNKWCALCERDGHESVDCPFEDVY